MMLHTCAVIIIKGHLSRESLLPLIFHVLESVSIIIYKSNDNSNTFIIYVLYHYPLCVIYIYIYIYIIFYIFHLIIRLKYNFHTIIWITQLILFISWNYIRINTLYSLTNTHNLSLTHTLSHRLTHYSLMSSNCLFLCKTHFLNINIVIEPTFCRKAKVLKNLFT